MSVGVSLEEELRELRRRVELLERELRELRRLLEGWNPPVPGDGRGDGSGSVGVSTLQPGGCLSGRGRPVRAGGVVVARVWSCGGRVVALLRRPLTAEEAGGLAEGFAGLVEGILERRERELLEGPMPRLRVEGRRVVIDGLIDGVEAVRARAWLSWMAERLLAPGEPGGSPGDGG